MKIEKRKRQPEEQQASTNSERRQDSKERREDPKLTKNFFVDCFLCFFFLCFLPSLPSAFFQASSPFLLSVALLFVSLLSLSSLCPFFSWLCLFMARMVWLLGPSSFCCHCATTRTRTSAAQTSHYSERQGAWLFLLPSTGESTLCSRCISASACVGTVGLSFLLFWFFPSFVVFREWSAL